MDRTVRLAIVGDYDAGMYTHRAIDAALRDVLESRGRAVEWMWLDTAAVEADPGARLAGMDGLWLAPASPYRSTEGALIAARIAREGRLPFLGVCGGFQHAILEFARHVVGLGDAAHGELDPSAARPVISALECDLRGRSGVVFLEPASRVANIYGRWRVVERYHCAYGLNPEYRAQLERFGLRVTGSDEGGDARVVELLHHPFFMATLFQPQLASAPGSPAPLVRAFVDAAIGHRDQGQAALELVEAPV